MTYIRLGHGLSRLHPNLHNGPGLRLCIWTQGCVHRCTQQCLNPHYLDPEGGFRYRTEEVVAAILEVAKTAPRLEGITVLGGEPFEQPSPVADICQATRATGLSTMVYSGHTLTHLRRQADSKIDRLLDATDLLVDGPFLPELRDERLAWRGSTNQRLNCLTERYEEASLAAAFVRQGKGFSVVINGDGISLSGFQSREIAKLAEDFVDETTSSNLL
ncbi:radical SAM protein [Blastopirellula sp. JC732]|uniref:Radical SAM protein n=1 Tax=Blastopirellula sediminis TaxID=2894196 RepID=A0A9X1MIC2_9BACT|nr:4Fe-4S single cluster domain-containing protein [Blastopirellula sediminis]MCC9608101.1 radical SAM protein [Blastopirellula sediminis]MCC9627106.1 radical SAM protein [Blastopirellula sediminis]